MASRRGGKQLVDTIESAAALDDWIEKSDRILVVVDLHKSWCGPCVVMEPAYQRLTLELDSWEDRVKFLTCDTSLLTDKQRETFPVNEGCKPSFVVMKHKVVIGKIQGANAPELTTIVLENVFPPPSKDDE